MGHVLFPLGGGSDTSAVTATAPDIVSGKVIIDSNGNLITGTMPTMAGSTITPSKSRQTISCSGKKMTSNIIVEAISDQYTQLQPGQVVFPEGVSPELIGVHPYYPWGVNEEPFTNRDKIVISEQRVSFNGNYPRIWSTANYYGEHSDRILFSGSIDPSKYSGMWIYAIGLPTVEPDRADSFNLYYYDVTTKKAVGHEIGPDVRFNIPYNQSAEINYLLRFEGKDSQVSRQVFVYLEIATSWSDDPNGGNHFFSLKKIQLVPK